LTDIESPAPDLSVVVLPFAGADSLEACLRALGGQKGPRQLEIIVPVDSETEWAIPVAESGNAKVARVERGAGHPARRSAGIAACAGQLIALTEDYCIPDADWCASVRAAHAEPHAVIGGVVDKRSGGGAVAWALYLADYGRYMPPLAAGPATQLTDCNVSYKRDALESVRQLWLGEFHDTVVHGALLNGGHSLWLSPDLRVEQHLPLTLADALRERFANGWTFAGARSGTVSKARRMIYAALAPLLPGVIVQRAARNVGRTGRHRGEFVRALPALAATGLAWAAGEIAGYVSGRGPARVSGGSP
jgi:hypothetical protein